MLGYSAGEIANSLLGNSITGFAMLFYTEALGLSPKLAGIAMAIAVFWDAVTDPLMGHITDNTRSRFGRRHPYILLGGIAVTIIYVFVWYVPGFVQGHQAALFWYLVVVNLLQRTAITVYLIPYVALGFEICGDYNGRVTLQGIRSGLNMLANLLGPALAWTLFFSDNSDLRATAVPQNYLNMGLSFAAVSLVSILFVTFITRKHIVDSTGLPRSQNSVLDFFRDMRTSSPTSSPPRLRLQRVVMIGTPWSPRCRCTSTSISCGSMASTRRSSTAGAWCASAWARCAAASSRGGSTRRAPSISPPCSTSAAR